MQDEKLRSRARHDRIGAALRVAELDEDRGAIERFHHCPHLAARETL